MSFCTSYEVVELTESSTKFSDVRETLTVLTTCRTFTEYLSTRSQVLVVQELYVVIVYKLYSVDETFSSDSSIYSLYSSSQGIYAGGTFTNIGPYLVRWNGSSYENITGLNNEITCISSGSNKLYVNQNTKSGIFSYDGSSWTQNLTVYDAITTLNGRVYSFVTSSQGIYGIGVFSLSGSKTNNVNSSAALFDGNYWQTLTGSGVLNISSDSYMQVITSSLGLYAATEGGVFFYNSSSAGWTELTDPSYGGLVNCHCVISTSLGVFVGGDSTLNASVGNSLARWNGTNWKQVIYNLNGPVYKLYEESGELYIGGNFSFGNNKITTDPSGLISLNNIAKIKLSDVSDTGYTNLNQVGINSYRNGFISKININNDVIYDIISDTQNIYFAGKFLGTRSGPVIVDNNNKFAIEGYTFSDNLTIPSPQLFYNNFIPPSIGNTSSFSDYSGKKGMKIYEVSYDNGIATQNIYDNYEFIYTINDGYIYETQKISNKKPFFNSYLDFANNLKPISKNYGYVPEYIISDFIQTYVKDKNGNFNSSINVDYLQLEGLEKQESFTDLNTSVNNTSIINTQIVNDYNPDKISLNLKISGLKKFRPSRDFYAHERIITLSKYFINSILTNNNYTSSIDTSETYSYALSNGSPLNSQILSILQPFFAPGILLNTIKSSIAVDFPTFITNSVNYDSPIKPDFYNSYADGYSLIKGVTKNLSDNSDVLYTGSMFIDKEQNFRFPFESLLDPDLYIPNEYKNTETNLYYLDPTHYTTDLLSGSEYSETVYPSYALKSGYGTQGGLNFKDSNYKLAIHNFLAEIPNFYLKNGELTSFKSKPEYQFKSAQAGVSYYMDVIIEKSNKYDSYISLPFLESLKKDISNYYNATYLTPSPDFIFGPPSRYWNKDLAPWLDFGYIVNSGEYCVSPYNLFSKLIDSPAYAPYVPPYFYGKCIARIKFTPKISGMYNLNEIFAESTVEFITTEADDLFAERAKVLHYTKDSTRTPGDTGPEGDTTQNQEDELLVASQYRAAEDAKVFETPAYKQMMRLTSSVNLFTMTELKEVNYNTDTLTPESVYDSSLRNNNIWVIQTKFETPSINFSNASLEDNIGLKFLDGERDISSKSVSGYFNYLFKGLWTTYGEPVKNGEGIQLSIGESFYNKNIDTAKTGSLLDMCGFQIDNKTIGLLEENKLVQESVVIIPYTFNKNRELESNTNMYAETIEEIIGENGIYSEGQKGNGPYYFKIDRKVLSDLLGVSMEKNSLVAYDQIKSIVNSSKVDSNNSIIKLIKSMTNFVIPPHLDWIRYRNIDPFVMYMADFNMNFDKEDLSDMWQGLMPKTAESVSKEEIIISHKLTHKELFHNKKLPEDIKFKIFKVKQKANVNYFKLTADNRDDKRFMFKFDNSQEIIPDFSYNWPYDYFSIVELINMDIKLDVDNT